MTAQEARIFESQVSDAINNAPEQRPEGYAASGCSQEG